MSSTEQWNLSLFAREAYVVMLNKALASIDCSI